MEFDEWAREVKLQEASVRIAPGWKDRRSAELRKIVRDGRFEVRDREGQPRRASLDDENRLEVLGEINRRSAMAWSPAPFALIGVPLGLITRRGKKIVGFAVSLGVVLVYYPMLVAGNALASKGVLPAWAALHMGDIVIGLCGLVMTVVFVWRR
jgi:lipopolysaccharide export LptBFGC system permease protein LptF